MRAAAWVLAAFLSLIHTFSAEPSGGAAAERAGRLFLEHANRFQTNGTNVVVAWEFGRACFDHAEFARTNPGREKIASRGIAACRRAIELKPESAPAHYYLALNLGQLARTRTLGALRIVDEMERELKRAIELDEQFDFAGPHRSLGILYLEAPGWPASIGNRAKARTHLERAVKLSPHFPENRVVLLDAYAQWRDWRSLESAFKALNEIWPGAKAELSGSEWQEQWKTWSKERARIKDLLEQRTKRDR
jgi:tetratricopeptide (TPR) repeat protein